jgi:hypothetical protein
MKTTISLLFIAAILTGCASAQPNATPATAATAQPAAAAAPAKPATLKALTHADLQAAAAYATAHGYPARAAMWTAIEAQLTAAENQVAACKAAIDAALPKAPAGDIVGLATLTEVGAEAVAQGIPAAVKANCEPIVIPANLLPVPKL